MQNVYRFANPYEIRKGVKRSLVLSIISITVVFTDLPSRARSFGIISASGGIGAAAGPLIGGLIMTTISWRASFILQVLVVAGIILLARRIADPGIQGAKPRFDLTGAILPAASLFFVVLGILQSGTYGWITASKNFSIGNVVVIPQGGISPVWLFIAIGAIFLLLFFLHISRTERAGKEPLLHIRLFRNRTSNLGLVTQNVQWLIMQGSFFVVSVYLQTVHGYSAIQAGLTLTAATVGILLSSGVAGRLAKRYAQRNLIRVGFLITTVGMILLLLLVRPTSSVWTFLPGLFLMGLGIGLMLTSSVNVVQSSFPERDQGEISGLSRSISNLGSSLGTAIVGSVLVTTAVPVNKTYGLAIIVTIVISCIGLVAALLLPPASAQAEPARAGLAAGGQ
jgi:MFS family permease